MINKELFSVLKLDSDPLWNAVSSLQVCEKSFRLDAGHFRNNVNHQSNFTTKPLSSFVQDIIEPKLFTRFYCDRKFGVPYISSSEMSELEPALDGRFISKEFTNNLDDYIIKTNQILISAAGTVGTIVLAPDYLNGVAGTSDILRLSFNERQYPGFIFTCLHSPLGQNQLQGIAYGAIIKRIRGFQLAKVQIPDIPDTLKRRINEIVINAKELRECGHKINKEAKELIYTHNNLKELPYQDNESTNKWNVSISECMIGEFRLDAHFYNPLAQLAERNIKGCGSIIKTLSELAERIIMGPRFKRDYVDSKQGIPFLSGKNIVQIRPQMKYLSNIQISEMEELIIKRDWILITCSGTIGRTCFVFNNYENYAASQHILRVIPTKSEDRREKLKKDALF